MTDASHVESWNDYRRRVRWFFDTWLGGFVLAAALAAVLSYTPARGCAPLAVGILWIAAFSAASFHLQLFSCPRCHEQFFTGYGAIGHLPELVVTAGYKNGSISSFDGAAAQQVIQAGRVSSLF